MDYVYIYLIGLLGCTILFSIAHNMSDEEAVESRVTKEIETGEYKEVTPEEGNLQVDSAVIVSMAIFWPVVLPFVVLHGLSRAIIKIGR